MVRQQYPGFEDKRMMPPNLYDRRTQCISREIQAEPGTPTVGHLGKEVTGTRNEFSPVLRHERVLVMRLATQLLYYNYAWLSGALPPIGSGRGNRDGAFRNGTRPARPPARCARRTVSQLPIAMVRSKAERTLPVCL